MSGPRSDACSVQWEDAGMPALGTAPRARFFVALEQNGPWGHDAIADSHLPAQVGRTLEQTVGAAGGRLLLIRRPGPHSDGHHPGEPVTVLISGGPPTDSWLLEGQIDDPEQLLTVPWRLTAQADPDALTQYLPELEETRTPHLLVCTNAKRDVCCALRGRPVALEAAQRVPGSVWECSHTGGHRFAPTGILLPFGQVLARLTSALAVEVLQSAGRRELPASLLSEQHLRGCGSYSPEQQAAEVAVRGAIQEPGLEALTVAEAGPALVSGDGVAEAGSARVPGGGVPAASDGSGGDAVSSRYRVTHRDGRSWMALVCSEPGPELKASCLKRPKPSRVFSVQLSPA